MKTNLKTEIILIGIILTPLFYLLIIWNSLPEEVPLHWNWNGKVNKWGNKIELLLVSLLLPILTYIIFLLVPKFDPKQKIKQMGSKFHQLKFSLVFMTSMISVFIIQISKNKSFNKGIVLMSVGLILAILGNFFKVLRPNYFIGIRTPWTLESESVWIDTHRFTGKYWFWGGILITLSSLILPQQITVGLIVLIIAILAIGSVWYSYLSFKKVKNSK